MLAVKFANRHSLGISVMSTGHEIHDRNAGPGNDALLIRTTCFQSWEAVTQNSISMGPGQTWTEGYAKVGAGLTFGPNFWLSLEHGDKDLYSLAMEYGREIVGGTCPSVGIVGWTLGGGRGTTSNKYGLGVDQLLHVDMVSAEGELISANYSSNMDLFYAIRGGGGGFGIIYSITIKLHRPTSGQEGNYYPIQIQ